MFCKDSPSPILGRADFITVNDQYTFVTSVTYLYLPIAANAEYSEDMKSSLLMPVSLLCLMLMALPAFGRDKNPLYVPANAHMPEPAVTDDYIHQQFGADCSLLQGPPQYAADLDGDGVEDLVVAARCKNPMVNQAEFGYQVTDPYMKFLGFGDTRITSSFDAEAPERKGVCLLIVEGNGADAWRSTTPKAKFLMINMPFRSVSVKRLELKKRHTMGVYMEEAGEGESTSSVVFWDGKRYRYMQLGSSME